MTPEQNLDLDKSWVIEVLPDGEVDVIEEFVERDLFKRFKKFPTDPGIYQWRPVAREWGSDAEHGSWREVYDWAPGELPREEWPKIHELPEK